MSTNNSTYNIVETMYVTKQLGGKEDLLFGFKQVLQNRAGDANTEITQLNASHFRGVLAFKSIEELNQVDTQFMGDYKFAIVQETGQIYFYENGKWNTPASVSFQVNTIDDLVNAPADAKVCLVLDRLRGGVFVYDDSKKSINNKGTIINGWVRQYFGDVDVKWFGALGNGTTDDTEAIQNAVNAEPEIFLSSGNYLVSDTITIPQNHCVKGTPSSFMYLEEDGKVVFKLSSYSEVRGVMFKGLADRQSQGFIAVDGGASLGEVSKTKVIGCTFMSCGGSAYKITNVVNHTNILAECVFLLNSTAIECGVSANGVSISNCTFEQNKTAFLYNGGSGEIVGSHFTRNNYAVQLISGQQLPNSKFVFSSCVFENSAIYDIFANECNIQKIMFDSCIVSNKIFIQSTTGLRFNRCNLTNCAVTFNSSDDNIFDSCITEGLFVTNDYQGIKTRNFFINSFTGHSYSQFDSSDLEGGYLEVVKDDSNYQIPQGNACYTIPFNKVIKQSLPYHEDYSKTQMFVSANNVFDFTQFVTPSSKNEIKADISIVINSNANGNNFSVFLYKVDSVDEDPNQNTDLNKIEAFLAKSDATLGSGFMMYNFCGTIRRGMYKLVVRNNNVSGLSFLKQGTTYKGTGLLPYKARFWGI